MLTKEKSPVIWKVQSSTDKSKWYNIRKGKDNQLYCECMGYKMSRTVPKTCSHLRAVQEKE